MQEGEELTLQLYGASAEQLPGNVLEVTISTSKGEIKGLLHPAEGETGAAIWIGGASGDMNGPAGGLYADLSHELVKCGITSFRLHYRRAGEFDDCVLDALASVSFLRGIGATKIAIVGHSFGGAVAIMAGALSPAITAVSALSSQNAGTHLASDLAPRPLLLVHGMDDFVVPGSCSEEIYKRAQDPKQLVLYPGTGHGLMESRSDLEDLLREWLADKVGSLPASEVSAATKAGTTVCPIIMEGPNGIVVREVALFQGDITEIDAEAIVCPTNDYLWLGEGVARAIVAKGGEEILYDAQQHAPAEVGSATVLRGGNLRAKYVIAAVTGASLWGERLPDEDLVREATRNCLKRAAELQLKSVAFPALGTGGGGFAFEKAASIMVKEVMEHLQGSSTTLEKVIFALFNAGAYRAFEGEIKRYS